MTRTDLVARLTDLAAEINVQAEADLDYAYEGGFEWDIARAEQALCKGDIVASLAAMVDAGEQPRAIAQAITGLPRRIRTTVIAETAGLWWVAGVAL